MYFIWGYIDRDIRLGAVHYHSEQDLAFGQYQTKLFYDAFFQRISVTLRDPAETIWHKLLHSCKVPGIQNECHQPFCQCFVLLERITKLALHKSSTGEPDSFQAVA